MENGITNPDIRRRFPDLHPAFTKQEAAVEANRCLYCADAPCASACPTHIDVPKFIKKIASDNLRGSALAILDANILGASCSRVCPVDVLCEGACVMHRFNREPIEIGRLQRFAMDAFFSSGWTLPTLRIAELATLKVACIGGGPASLSCAAELARRGHHAVIFDGRQYPGGLNTYGVAEYKFRAADSVEETRFIESLGVEIRSGQTVDARSLARIAEEFDAVFLGIGNGRMEPLGIPGEGLSGVIDGLRLIADYKTAQTVRVKGRVVVVGAGNTAIDAAVAAMKMGAERAVVVYRRTQREMPAFAFEYEHAKGEGVDFCWSSRPIRVVGASGNVAGLECVRVKPNLESIAGSEFTIGCEMVVPAIGQSRSSALLAGIPGIDIRRGLIAVDRETGRTGNPKFYAGGDIVNGGREVVDAVADGKRAALAMIAQLRAGATHA
jgi:glutamate synthase (NADPH/NADH) small chain